MVAHALLRSTLNYVMATKEKIRSLLVTRKLVTGSIVHLAVFDKTNTQTLLRTKLVQWNNSL